MSALHLLLVFGGATLVGYRLIGKVPSLLHTPLMSGMNALSGITLLGALALAARQASPWSRAAAAVAIVLATVNVVAGFVVTGRMLRMFRREAHKAGDDDR